MLNQYIRAIPEIKTTLPKTKATEIIIKAPKSVTIEHEKSSVKKQLKQQRIEEIKPASKGKEKNLDFTIEQVKPKKEEPLFVNRRKNLSKRKQKMLSDARKIIEDMKNHYYKFYAVRLFNSEKLKESPKLKKAMKKDEKLNIFNIRGINDISELDKFLKENPKSEVKFISGLAKIVKESDVRAFFE